MIELRVIGEFAVYRAERLVPAAEVGSRKARTLLALLATRREQSHPDRIVEALWGNGRPRHPAGNVATLVSRLRSVLGDAVIVRGRVGYQLGGHVRVDLFAAADLVSGAEQAIHGGRPDLAMPEARKAVRLLDKEPMLAHEPWAHSARLLADQLLRRARAALAEAALNVGDTRTATVAAGAAVRADSLDEAAYRVLMRAHYAAGDRAQALCAYGRLRATLSAELGVDPARATRDLHVVILQDSH
jgi:DNA-binding SARP family transcriptional activator